MSAATRLVPAVLVLSCLAIAACVPEESDSVQLRREDGERVQSPGAGGESVRLPGDQGVAGALSGTLESGGGPGAAGRPTRALDSIAEPHLVDVTELDSTFILDIRYATPRNFTGKTLYPVGRCLLRPQAAERLVRVHARLKEAGLRLRLFDCYRPLSIQRELWALVPDERYVADPAKGSRHNRAAAVDLTLADSTGAELPMPTEYDDFTHRAHRDYAGASAERRANRDRLERAMASEGFVGLPTEWSHFDAPDWKEHAILDVPLTAVAP